MLTVVTTDSVIKYSVGKFVLHFVVIIIFFLLLRIDVFVNHENRSRCII